MVSRGTQVCVERSVAPELKGARAELSAFLGTLDRNAPVTVLHDSDADGVTAGVVCLRALERLGFTAVTRVVPTRTRDAWAPENRALVTAANPQALFVLDLGSRDEVIVADAATCLIDHHRPEGVPPGATLISAYAWDPIPNTSLLVHDLFSPIVDLTDVLWIAAVGVISDLGERAPFALLDEARKRYTSKDLKEVTTLINAARRASHYAPERAARALLANASPRDLLLSDSDDVLALRDARAEVNVAMTEAKKAAPVFSGKVALIRMSSRCQIHPLIAQIWRGRLPKYVVFAANEGYVPGRVNFSARSSGELKALDLLKQIELSPGEGGYARGHDHASGGSLETHRWNELLTKLGFPQSVLAM